MTRLKVAFSHWHTNIADHNVLLTLLAWCIPVFCLLTRPSFPQADSAAFEVIGRSVLEGHKLYVDIWDNKLPTVYLINALWSMVLGSRYFIHAIAETLINILSIVVFSAILRSRGIPQWGIATLLLSAAISFPYQTLNLTEYYALPLLLGAVLCFEKRPFWSGIFLAVAGTLWIPSVFLLAALLTEQDPHQRRATLLAMSATGAALIALFFAAFPIHTIWQLIGEWQSYLLHPATHNSLQHAARSLVEAVLITGVFPLLLVLAAFYHRPVSKNERFGLKWIGCSLAGASISFHFFAHYFLPAIPALLFAIEVYRQKILVTKPRLGIVVLASLVMLSQVPTIYRQGLFTKDIYKRTQTIGAIIVGALGENAPILMYRQYSPQIYLAAKSMPPDKFALVGHSENLDHLSEPSLAHVNVVIVDNDNDAATLPKDFVRVPTSNITWLLFTRTHLLQKFTAPRHPGIQHS